MQKASLTNKNQHDNVNGFTGSFYRTHQFSHLQAYYGVTGTVGSYEVEFYDSQLYGSYNNRNLNDFLINTQAGTYAFAFMPGVNYRLSK